MVAHGLPPLGELEIGRFCSFVWWFFTRNMTSQTDRDKFKAKLWRPPPGQAVTDSRSPWAPENEMSAFSSLKQSLGK